jgi:glycosyltransferase involved in cell wall biosynthesis
MRICYLFQDEYPWDVRADKILRSLAAAGIDTHVVARNRTGLPRLEAVGQRVTVHRLPSFRHRGLTQLLNFPVFFSPLWISTTLSTVRRTCADLLIVRDLPLSPAALWAAHRLGVPVLMDMAEDYPAMISDTWRFRGASLFDRLLRNPSLLRRMERFVVQRLDGALVVSPHSARRVARLGLPSKAIWVVSNTPEMDRIQRAPLPAPPPAERRHPRPQDARSLALLYVGGLEESRGLDVVVSALPAIRARVSEVVFHILGKGTAEQSLRALAERLNVAGSVVWRGWVAPGDVPSAIRDADICVVPHRVTQHTNTTVPNKIFDYMAQRRPVIVSDATALREIVESSGCGCVFDDGDPTSFAAAVTRLIDPASRAAAGEAGLRAVRDRFNWAHDEAVLLEAVRSFAPH